MIQKSKIGGGCTIRKKTRILVLWNYCAALDKASLRSNARIFAARNAVKLGLVRQL